MEKHNLFYEMIAGAMSNAITSSILNPMDVSKTKMQVENQLTKLSTDNRYRTLPRTVLTIYQQDGLAGLWLPGLGASFIREIVYCGIRTGCYSTVRD
jgi:hypothetical protein